MKKYLLSIALISFLSLDIRAHVNHYSNYNYLEYELYRNNKLIGYHIYKFQRSGDNLSIDKKVEFDYYYCKNQSVFFDFKILFLTLMIVLSRKNIRNA